MFCYNVAAAAGKNERTNEYWVIQDTDGKGRLTQGGEVNRTFARTRNPNPGLRHWTLSLRFQWQTFAPLEPERLTVRPG